VVQEFWYEFFLLQKLFRIVVNQAGFLRLGEIALACGGQMQSTDAHSVVSVGPYFETLDQGIHLIVEFFV
jgi:hypothetical protein